MALLEIEGLKVLYGRVEALHGIDLSVEEGEVVTLIGSNGAGKTTTVRTISGLVPASGGRIMLDGKEISGLPAPEIVKRGIGHSPEGRHVFPRLSVRDNLIMGAYLRRDKNVKKDMDRVFKLFPRLLERDSQLAGTLSGGEQQMLAMGRAMMTHPRVLLLDEPSLGLSPVLVETIFQVIGEPSRGGDHDPADRAERAASPEHRQSWVCDGDRQHRDVGQGRRPPRVARCQAGLSRHLDPGALPLQAGSGSADRPLRHCPTVQQRLVGALLAQAVESLGGGVT